jgi:hypothetical protein
LTQFKAILDGTAAPASLAVSAALLALVAILAFGLTLRRLRRGFAV